MGSRDAWLGRVSFGMPVWETDIAVALSFWLALVACRVTGETDTTPVGAMGKATQLIFGALHPGIVNINLMSANIPAGAATSSADLLTEAVDPFGLTENQSVAEKQLMTKRGVTSPLARLGFAHARQRLRSVLALTPVWVAGVRDGSELPAGGRGLEAGIGEVNEIGCNGRRARGRAALSRLRTKV
jgi:hypothetical protein